MKAKQCTVGELFEEKNDSCAYFMCMYVICFEFCSVNHVTMV